MQQWVRGRARQDPQRWKDLQLVLKCWVTLVWVQLIKHAEVELELKSREKAEQDALDNHGKTPFLLQERYYLLVNEAPPAAKLTRCDISPGRAWRQGRRDPRYPFPVGGVSIEGAYPMCMGACGLHQAL